MDSVNTNSKLHHVYDVRTDKWTARNPLPTARSGHGGVLYCLAEPTSKNSPGAAPAGWEKFECFRMKSSRVMQKFRATVEPLVTDGPSKLGIYVPLRAIPYLSAEKIFSGIRFFDDDVGLHGWYFDGFDILVENFADLVESPASTLLIASLAFGERIKVKVRAKLGNRVELVSWEQMLSI